MYKEAQGSPSNWELKTQSVYVCVCVSMEGLREQGEYVGQILATSI